MPRLATAILMGGTALLAGAGSAQAQMTWQGGTLSVTRDSPANCTVGVGRADVEAGQLRQIFVTVRNTGTVPLRFAADLTLSGNNQSKTGTLGSAVVAPGQPVRMTTGMYPFGGSLAGTTLAIAIRDCRPA